MIDITIHYSMSDLQLDLNANNTRCRRTDKPTSWNQRWHPWNLERPLARHRLGTRDFILTVTRHHHYNTGQVSTPFVCINRVPRPGVLFLDSLPLGVIILTVPGSCLGRGEACGVCYDILAFNSYPRSDMFLVRFVMVQGLVPCWYL